jgi:hypothetical protein
VGKKSASPTDVAGAARETGQEARWLAREQTAANRPNQYNPWGSTTWEKSVVPGTENDTVPQYSWTQRETLNPQLQGSLNAQFGTQQNRSKLAQQLSGQLANDMGTPVDWDQYGEVIGFDPAQQRQHAEDSAYQSATNRLDPQFQSQANQLEISLRNKGLRPGDQAYDSAMANFGRTRNDAYEQARLGSVSQGRDETALGMQTNEYANQLRSQQIQEDLYKRGYTLEQINALMQGQELEGSSPSMSEKATIADQLLSAPS